MYHVELKPPVDGCSFEQQATQLWGQLTRINRELPILSIIQARQASMAATGSAFDTGYDHFMCEVVASPYFADTTPQYAEDGELGPITYTKRLISGLSSDGQILHVGAEHNYRHSNKPAGYVVNSLDLSTGERTDWPIRVVERRQGIWQCDAELYVGRAALTLIQDGKPDKAVTKDLRVRFVSPSRSDASITDGDQTTYFNQLRLRYLFAIDRGLRQYSADLLYGEAFREWVQPESASIAV